MAKNFLIENQDFFKVSTLVIIHHLKVLNIPHKLRLLCTKASQNFHIQNADYIPHKFLKANNKEDFQDIFQRRKKSKNKADKYNRRHIWASQDLDNEYLTNIPHRC